MIEELKNKIFSGEMITKDEAMSLIDAPLDELCKAADEIVHNRRFTAPMLRNIRCLIRKQ